MTKEEIQKNSEHWYNKYKDAEKRIEELKKQLEMSNKVYNDNLDYSHHIEEQLTKATELLKEAQGYIENNDDELYDKIEQFLKEIKE